MSASAADLCRMLSSVPSEQDQQDLLNLQSLQVPLPMCECERITLLRETHLLDSEVNESDYARYTNLAARIFEAPIALVSLMDVSRQWFKARVGLEVPETHRDVAFCSYVLLESAPDVLIVPDATQDPRFQANPLVLGYPNIRFYAGAPLRLNGIKIGTLCIIDSVSRGENQFGGREALMLQDIAAMVSALIVERRRDIMQLQSELANLTMNVLNGIKKPLQALTREGQNVERDLIRLKTGTAHSLDGDMHMFGRSVHGFASAVESMEKVLELNLKAVESLVKDSTACNKRPRMTSCNIQKIVDLLHPILHCLNPLLDEKVWCAPLEALAASTETLTWFSHPEILTLTLCSLIAGSMHGNTFFIGLEFSMNSLQKNVRISDGVLHNIVKDSGNHKKHSNHAWNNGELVFTISHAFGNAAEGFSSFNVSDCFDSLKQVLQWVGGSLSVSSVSEKSLLLYHVTIPFRSIVEELPHRLSKSSIMSSQQSLKSIHSSDNSSKSVKGLDVDEEETTVIINGDNDQISGTVMKKGGSGVLKTVLSSSSLLLSSAILVKPGSCAALVSPIDGEIVVSDGHHSSPKDMFSMVGRFVGRLIMTAASTSAKVMSPIAHGSKQSTACVHPTTSCE